MPTTPPLSATLLRDLTSGVVVFLVALPLCLGVALASNAPLFSGLLAGIVGGIVVGFISRSQTSVSGPAAGLATVVAAQILSLGSFPTFLFAVLIAGVIQIVLGLARAGFIAALFPTSVINGLLAAIGILLILKQIPHVFGHDNDPEGDMAFQQADQANTFSELWQTFLELHPGALSIGICSVALLILWSSWKPLKTSPIPAPLVVVLLGIVLAWLSGQLGGIWAIEPDHFVQVPVAKNFSEFLGFLQWPDFTQWANPAVYVAGLTIAAVASLETLLNLEAVDKIDPKQRISPPSRELLAQGIGNVLAGLIGGIPITSVIVRSSVNINAGAQTKVSAIVHGVLLLVSVAIFPLWLNKIPLACLAAILLVTGYKLASPKLIRQMWKKGPYQFVPFAITVLAIVFTDLLVGVLIGLALSLSFILNSHLRRPIRRVVEKHLGGDVLRIELANQVSFLNREALQRVLDEVPSGAHVLLNAQNTDYIDPDVLDLLRDYTQHIAPDRGVSVSLLGFRNKYDFSDRMEYSEYSTKDIQGTFKPAQVLQLLKEGHDRFRAGRPLTRDLNRQIHATAESQHPLAVILSCIDSRVPAELLLDQGLGDILSVRIAGNILSREVLGSMEYACAVAGVKLVLVMGHTRCGAVTSAVDFAGSAATIEQATGCQHLGPIIEVIQQSIDPLTRQRLTVLPSEELDALINHVVRDHVLRVVDMVPQQSQTLDRMSRDGEILICGAVYDVSLGQIEFLPGPA